MATYKIDSSLLTAQADEIRTLNGTTATMNPSEMTTALQSANAEVAAQEQKIIEITEMLQGKAMGGGSGGSASYETCSVTVNRCRCVSYTGVENGALVPKTSMGTSTEDTHNFVAHRNSLVSCSMYPTGSVVTLENAEQLDQYGVYFAAFCVTGESASIDYVYNSGGAE